MPSMMMAQNSPDTSIRYERFLNAVITSRARRFGLKRSSLLNSAWGR